MRTHGLVQSAADLGLHGHACWTYDDEADFPMAALCCYDRRALAPQTIDDLCAVHPAGNGGPPFHVYAEPSGLTLEGQVDFFSAAPLRRALVAAGDSTPLDLTAVTFADHHGMRALVGSGLPLRGIPSSMRRVCELMGLEV